MSANQAKYRAVEEAQAEEEEDAEEPSAAAVPNEEFHWLEPKEFVASYKQSDFFRHVEETIDEATKHLNHDPESDKVSMIVSCLLLCRLTNHPCCRSTRPRSILSTTPGMPNTPSRFPSTPSLSEHAWRQVVQHFLISLHACA
jgi:hypothetical protein